jgi:hypothetical protein
VITGFLVDPANPELAQRGFIVSHDLEVGLSVSPYGNISIGPDNRVSIQYLQGIGPGINNHPYLCSRRRESQRQQQ